MKWSKEKSITLMYFLIYLVVVLSIALHQPLYDTFPYLSNPPDEHSRYRVPLYICNHGTLPTGFEEELFSGECKWTYGFYTLLPYMVQGYAMRLVNLFTDSELILLYTARFVNVALGLVMAYIVLLLGKKLFQDDRVRWLFCFLVMFLPQSLFLHSYVNPDSMCLLSTALMLYGLIRGYEDGFSVKSCAFLTIGVVLCALSYYNAYGYIPVCALLFVAYFLKKEDGKWKYDWRNFLKKGIPICVAVLLCISWSFIRNFILYDGDIIGLKTMGEFIKSNGIIRETPQSQGKSLYSMLFETNFFHDLYLSFVASYGSVSIRAKSGIYWFYRIVFALGIFGVIFCKDKNKSIKDGGILFHAGMAASILIPFIILIRFAYTVDYQAQGRYIIPGLIPFMYYVTHGLEKLPLWRKSPEKWKNVFWVAVMAGIVGSLLIMVYVTAMPVYLESSVL